MNLCAHNILNVWTIAIDIIFCIWKISSLLVENPYTSLTHIYIYIYIYIYILYIAYAKVPLRQIMSLGGHLWKVQLQSLWMGKHQISHFIIEIIGEIWQQLYHKCCLFCTNSVKKSLFLRLDRPRCMSSPRRTSPRRWLFLSTAFFPLERTRTFVNLMCLASGVTASSYF